MGGKKYGHKLMQDKKRLWIVGPTYDLGEKEFRVIWDDIILGMGLGRDKTVKKAYSKKQGNMFIEMPWGSRLEVRSAEHREYLIGDSLDGVLMSEAAKHDPETWFRFIRPALADRKGVGDFLTTPEGQNWLYPLFQIGQQGNDPEYASFQFPSWVNPYVYPLGADDPEIAKLRAEMSPETFMQEIAAEFTSFEGKIYPDFTDRTHVKRFDYNPMWRNYITFDFGYVNPLAAVEFMVDPWDNIWIWREHYKNKMTNEQHIRALIARANPERYHLDLGFGDAADPEAIEYINQHFVQCMGDPLSKENWRDGVDLVNSFVRMQVVGMNEDTGELIEEPKLFVHPDCPNVIREFTNYKSPKPTTGRNPRAARETGLAVDDHAMDAIRYGLMHLFKLGLHGDLGEANPKLRIGKTTSVDVGHIESLTRMSDADNLPIFVGAARGGDTFVNMDMEF